MWVYGTQYEKFGLMGCFKKERKKYSVNILSYKPAMDVEKAALTSSSSALT